ncbi:MAG: arginine deiminase family protein [Vicinamibacteria bacterium]
MEPVFHFDRALTRAPSPSVVNGLRDVDRGAPTLEGVRREFDAYVAALRDAGLVVETLPPKDEFPDSVFIEDPALVFGDGAILLRPRAPSRLGEAGALAPVLRNRFDRVLQLDEGFAEGGDMLTTPDEVLIGLSARTSEAGARAVARLLEEFGRRARIVTTPPGVLHLKTDCALLDEETILATSRLEASGIFSGYRVLLTPEGEQAAANALRVNDRVFVGDRFPRTLDLLEKAGYDIVPLQGAQIALLDAGFSCLSLRFKARN